MKRCLSGIAQGLVYISAALQKKRTEPPMSVEGSTIQIKVLAQRLQRFTASKEISDRTYITVVSTMPDQGDAVRPFVVCPAAAFENIED
jgi:hypothetical protein